LEREHFITADTLERRLGEDGLSIVCNFMVLPGDEYDGPAEFAQTRIPGAVYFDLDEIADKSSKLPHMIATPEQFSRQMSELGISHDDDIVVYDRSGLFSSARIWWNLRLMGATNVRILEGGFERWKRENRPMETTPHESPEPTHFIASIDGDQVVDAEQVLKLIYDNKGTILDARSTGRYNGESEEPRKGLRLGHMPGALSLPFTKLIEDGTLVDNNKLRNVLQPLLFRDGPIVTTCGSGVTAAVLTLALTCAGYDNHALYDGSWTEWGGPDDNYPIISGDDSNYG
jgi:thiosulfate/3-mercaptopyruvate sulfurtransferase